MTFPSHIGEDAAKSRYAQLMDGARRYATSNYQGDHDGLTVEFLSVALENDERFRHWLRRALIINTAQDENVVKHWARIAAKYIVSDPSCLN